MTEKRVQIFYSVDDRYSPYLATSIASLIDHTDINRKYTINIVHKNLNKENREKLKSLKTSNVSIKLIEMNNLEYSYLECLSLKIKEYI